jgi:hypothetical protein
MQSYYQRARTMFRLLPGDAIRRYILDTPTGETFLEMVALKIMAQEGNRANSLHHGEQALGHPTEIHSTGPVA